MKITLVAALLFSGVTHAEDHPCQVIKTACEEKGFKKGEAKDGTGLWKDCIEPVVEGKPQPKNAKLALPTVDPAVVAACKAMHGMGGEKHK